jgi:hypothetical protein
MKTFFIVMAILMVVGGIIHAIIHYVETIKRAEAAEKRADDAERRADEAEDEVERYDMVEEILTKVCLRNCSAHTFADDYVMLLLLKSRGDAEQRRLARKTEKILIAQYGGRDVEDLSAAMAAKLKPFERRRK